MLARTASLMALSQCLRLNATYTYITSHTACRPARICALIVGCAHRNLLKTPQRK